MAEKRVQFSNIVQNQLPAYVQTEFPLVSEFLKYYYIAQEFQGAPIDLIQNIDQYTKIDEFTDLNESVGLSTHISAYADVIPVDMTQNPAGTKGFPSSYGLIKIDDEIITYTGIANTAFTGCIRGFAGISSYRDPVKEDEVIFESTNAGIHSTGSTITNLSSLFLKEFFLKTKNQLLPGLEERPLDPDLNKKVFLKQAKDFYLSKGTDQSFEILFNALYNERVKIIKPRDFLFTPSNANYIIANTLVVESIDGNPEDLKNGTLYQDEYLLDKSFGKAYAPITNIEKIVSIGAAHTFYKLRFDAGYNRDVRVEGSLYGDFSVHPKTRLIGQVGSGATTLDVDSTVGFDNSGELSVTFTDTTTGIVSYTSKSLTQFYGCSDITATLADESIIGINTYAYGYSGENPDQKIKVRINSVLKDVKYADDTTYYGQDDIARIKTLGISDSSFKFKNWLYNISPQYKVKSIELIDSLDLTYKITLYEDNIFNIGDDAILIGSNLSEKTTKIIDILGGKSFIIRGQGAIALQFTYNIQRTILKAKSTHFPGATKYQTNIQNVYKEKYKDNLLVASSSLPSYDSQPLNVSDRSVTFSGTFSGEELNIGTHTFYTGDVVYYIPQKVEEEYVQYGVVKTRLVVKSSLFGADVGILAEGEIPDKEGVYYIKRISSTVIKLAQSKSDIYNSEFISIQSTTVTNCILELYKFRNKTLTAQKLLREIAPPINNGELTDTKPGFTGILVNGVEISNYKSTELIHYGKIENVDVLAPGSGYDVSNPPPLLIEDSVGTGATGYIAVSGSLQDIQIIDPGFDYEDTPIVTITGGNGTGATAEVNMTLIEHNVAFNSQESAQEVGLGTTVSTIGFSTYHKFRNAEKVNYITDNQKAISGLTTDASYFVSTVNNTTVKLHPTQGDAIAGINTVVLLAGGIGRHYLQSYNKKSIVDGINVVTPGSGYENKKITTQPTGISTYLNQITIDNHGYEKGEIVKYTSQGSVIGGLSDGSEYYVTKINDNVFKLSANESLCLTEQYIDLTSVGVGTHLFNYQDISVKVVGSIGISSIGSETFEAQIQPIFKGEITSVHLSNNGVGYGSSEIINYENLPEISVLSGSNAQLQPIINDGKIVEIVVLNQGDNYTSIPNLILDGDGAGASLTPIITNKKLTSVKIVTKGSGYTTAGTSIRVVAAGADSVVKFKANLQTWRINLFQKYFNSFTVDDGFVANGTSDEYGLQYSYLYPPRKLREIIFAVDQSGEILYGDRDLKRSNDLEINSTDHSPIIGWAYDGNPIYGPYGYSTNNGGVVTRMKSGYTEEATKKANRPSLGEFAAGFFIEDFTYYDVSDQAVLDENNGRFGVTPEFPNGTYAYFCTIEDGVAQDGPFAKYKIPVFPYFIGDKYYSAPNDYNFKSGSNQDHVNLNGSDWCRNTEPYNLIEDNLRYPYAPLPNDLSQTIGIGGVVPGSLTTVGIVTAGDSYRIGDAISFDNTNTKGYDASVTVSRVLGKSVSNVSVAKSTISNVEIYPSSKKGDYILFTENPHNFKNTNIINISGLSTTSSKIGGSYSVGISSNRLTVIGVGTTSSGIEAAVATGLVTYFNVGGTLTYPSIRENDILGVGTERVRVLNVDQKLSRIRVLREVDGTVGNAHTVTTRIYEDPRKLTVNAGFKSDFNYQLNRQIYFNPSESVGLGTTAAVGIGSTLYFSNPGAGLSEIFIPTKTVYIPDHKLSTGDQLTYSPGNGTGLAVVRQGDDPATGVSTFSGGETLYVAKISDSLIGLATVTVGLGTTGTWVGIATTANSTLYFSGVGTGVYHSFKTNYDQITGEISRQLVTVSTAQTHGLVNNNEVYVDVSPSIASTFIVKYNDYNRRVLVGIKTFTSSGVNTTTNTITLTDHGFVTGEKIIHTATTPVQGLTNEGTYYIVKIDNNNFKLSDSYYESIQPKPSIVGLGSTSTGNIGPINPPLTVYKNSTAIFDLSDSSLGYTNQGTSYSAFELNFYSDNTYTKLWDKNVNVKEFNVLRSGKVGIDANAKVTLTVNENLPDILYYRLDPLYDSTLPTVKEEIVTDTNVKSCNQIHSKESLYDGKHTITVPSTTSFTYTLPEPPERTSYASSITGGPRLSYETASTSALGPITKFDIKNPGRNYYEVPGITTIITSSGKGAEVEVNSNSLGKISRTQINDIGFDFASDTTLAPSVGLPQIVTVTPFTSLQSVGVTSVGRGYTSAPHLIVLDGKTGDRVEEIALKYTLGVYKVDILNNTYSLNDVPPTIIPIDNTNGVGIATVGFNTITKDVTVTMASGFSTANSFPFAVNDRVLIEGVSVGVGSTGIGYNSDDHNYQLFTLTDVDESYGGIGSVTYSLNTLDAGAIPGNFDEINSSGRIIPEKYFPQFKVDLKPNDFIIGETVESDSSTGIVEYWSGQTGILRISSKDNFVINSEIEGLTSKSHGTASSIRSYDSYTTVGAFSEVAEGWRTNSGVLNYNMQRLQDSDYYQNFSYSLSSRVTYDTWYDVVSALNHTLGFKKFSDLQCEPHGFETNNISANVGLTTDLTSLEVVNSLYGKASLNCVYGFDLVKENALNLNNRIVSTEIIFANRVLQDYMESKGNRVLSIDDFSSQFNSHPRPTAFSIVDRFLLSEMRARKFITYVQDQRYTAQRQLMIVDLIHDGAHGYINQYGRVESVYDQGSFDFKIVGSEGEVLFYPTKSSVNDYWITALSYNLDDNILGVGTTSIGGVSLVETHSTNVSSGTTTTIVSIASTYSSAKVLVEVTPDVGGDGSTINSNEFEFTELNIVHNGTDVAITEYGQLMTSLGGYSSAGYGTYLPYLDGSSLKVDFIPNAGIGTTAAVNTITVGLANSTYTGIGTVQMKHARLESVTTTIASSGSPTENVICEYEDAYDAGYFLVQVCDKTNNEYQLSEVAVVDNYVSGSGDTFDVEWANIETAAGLGTIGSRLNGSTVELVFTPLPSIDIEVNVFMNALRIQDDTQDEISFNNGSIRSGFGEYEGTDRDIKRAFGLTHKNYGIFERYFLGNDSSIVNVSADTIQIPNHFYVTGERINYTHVGTATSAIGIAATSFSGIGVTEYLPEELFVVKVNDDTIKIARNAEDALKIVPTTVDITSVGIGTSHRFVATNQNAKLINALDNVIQSPLVSTAVTTTLADQVFTTDNLIEFSGITSFYGADLIKIGTEIMKIEGVGIGSTNVMRVRRPWLGTVLAGYGTGELITKIEGNYNIVDNVLNYTEAPHGNRPIGSTTNPPDDRDWTGISTSSTFQGRVFMKSGITGSSTDSYYNNYIFDDISQDFTGIKNEFTLTADGSNITGITSDAVVIVNDIWQGRGTNSNFTLEESSGITSVTFTGNAPTIDDDINITPYPVGGIIVSVGSTEGLGYQPLVAAGGTAKVSTAGTVSTITIGYSGSGYRSGIGQTVNVSIQQEDLTTTNIVSIGTATIGSTGSLTGVAVTNTHVFYKPKTISNVGYNSITGMSTVTTLLPHGLAVGNEVVLSGIAFTCLYSGPKDITDFAYHASSGIVTVTTSGSHGYSTDQDVIFTGIAMTCGLDAGASTHYYPRGEDPSYNTAVSIASTTGTTITVNVGYSGLSDQYTHTWSALAGNGSDAVISGGDYEHQFVSAASSAVVAGGDYTHTFVSVGVGTITVTGIGSTTPTDATYTASTGELVLTVGSGHTYTTSDTVGIGTSALIFTCSMDDNATDHTYPRSTDPIIGVNTSITAVTDSTITVNVGASPLVYYQVSDATYHPSSGLSTITIGSHSLTTSTSIRLANDALTFRCAMDDYASLHTYPRSTDPGFSTALGITTTTSNTITVNVGVSTLVYHDVTTADYSANVGVMTMTIGAHTLKTGESIKLGTESLWFTCDKDSGVTTHKYPRKPDPFYTGSKITSVPSSTEFVTYIGISTVDTFYVSGGTVQGVIIAPRAVNNSASKTDPAYGQVIVNNVLDDYKFQVPTGISTRSHFYARGGKIEKPMKVLFDDPLSYTNIPLQYSSTSAVGIGSSATIDIQVGQGSSVIDFEIRNTGYGYGNGQILTVPIGGLTGIPTTSGFKEFNLTIDKTYYDKFTGWTLGELETLDNVEKYIDGTRVDFPLSLAGDVVSILAAKGSKIVLQDVLVVTVNDILQVPGDGYQFEGGSVLTFTEAPKIEDTIKIAFYKGSGSGDVIAKAVLETVKKGDNLTIGYDPLKGQASYLQEEPRTVRDVTSTDLVKTTNYFGPGNTEDSTLLRPVVWCRQTEDKIIDDKRVAKDREWYEANINPVAYIIKSVGIGSTAIYVDNVRPFFNPQNEDADANLDFQNKVGFVKQETKTAAAATAVVSGLGSISSIVISDGGVGYTTAFVSIASTVGVGTTTRAFGSVTIGTGGTITGVAITSPGVGYTNTNPPVVLISPPLSKSEENSVSSYSGDAGVIVGVGTTTNGAQAQLIFDLFIPYDSDLRDATVTGTAVTLSGISTNDYFMVYESNTGTASTSITSLDSSGSATVGIGTSFIDNVYSIQSFENHPTSIAGVTTYVRRVYVNTQSLITYGSGISTSDYFGEFSWGKIMLSARTGINSYTAYTLNGIGTAASGISTSTIVERTASLKSKNYSV